MAIQYAHLVQTTRLGLGRNIIQAIDYQDQYGAAFFKYNNGRFFLNAEYDWERLIENRIGNVATTSA